MTQLGKWELDTVQNTDALTLLAGLPDGCIDLIVTSPPYDNLRTYNGYSFEFEPIAHESYRVLKPGGVLVWVVGDQTVKGNETFTGLRQAIFFRDVVGFKAWDTMIRRRILPGTSPKRYQDAFEFMFVFVRGDEPKTFNPLMKRNKTAGRPSYKSNRNRGSAVDDTRTFRVAEYGLLENVWDIQGGHNAGDATNHPAPFPDEVPEKHILTWSNPGDLVVDYFGGSGRTAKMAQQHQRRYLTGDISAAYCDEMRELLTRPFTPSLLLWESTP